MLLVLQNDTIAVEAVAILCILTWLNLKILTNKHPGPGLLIL